jgi:hypothetical protein
MFTAFWDVAPCSVVEADKRFRGVIALMMEAVQICEMSVYFHETTQHYIPESCCLHTRRRENLRSHLYSSGSRLEYRLGTGYPDWDVSWLSSDPPGDCWGSTLKQTTNFSPSFLSNYLNVIDLSCNSTQRCKWYRVVKLPSSIFVMVAVM